MSDLFTYRDNQLYCEEVPVARIADEVATPTYVYSAETLRRHYNRLRQAFIELDPLICYSVKTCGNLHILKLLAECGSGFDVVSGGELYRVQQAGGDVHRVVYAGVGKRDEEIGAAIEAGIACFNVESEAELENLVRIAAELGKPCRAALRVNPNVDPKTHRHTTTGKKETKFGVDLERAEQVFERFGRDERVRLAGIHIHIGSPVNTVEPYVEAISKTLAFVDALRERGFCIETLNLGGGFGADYVTGQAPAFDVYAAALVPLLRDRGLRIMFEPGRSISGSAGILLTRVLYTKQGGEKTFAIVDAAMNDLIRPVLYDAFHFLWPVRVANGHALQERLEPVELPDTHVYDVVGPVCETGDFLARGRRLPLLARGDLLAVFTAGAYGFVMSSQYNARCRPAEVLVEGEQFRVIRRRETYDDLVALER